MIYLRMTVRLCLDGKLVEKCFDDVINVDMPNSRGFLRITKADGKTTAWFNMEYVYEVIIEVMG